jgi:predicted alpha/beta-hydrolase family hydrolase
VAIDGSLCHDVTVREIDTPAGLARVHLHAAPNAAGALILGHGAGGGIGARDLTATRDVALAAGFSVALVEQPYRVAGRRSPAPAHQLDAAWTAVVNTLREDELSDVPLITGGRSSGARVACRTAAETEAAGVLCLAFPLMPPRRAAGKPPATRQPELDAVEVPTLVVQGTGDPFGMPAPGPRRRVVELKGNHSLTSDIPGLREAVREWLTTVLAPPRVPRPGRRAARARPGR